MYCTSTCRWTTLLKFWQYIRLDIDISVETTSDTHPLQTYIEIIVDLTPKLFVGQVKNNETS